MLILIGNIESQKSHDQYLYRLAGPTCLAGDVIGDYILNSPLNVGDKVIFKDMAIYTMVKTNTFNGMPLPDIVNMTAKTGIAQSDISRLEQSNANPSVRTLERIAEGLGMQLHIEFVSTKE